jgi:hypothetical protein
MNGVEGKAFRVLIDTMGHGRSETRRGGDPGCGISEAGVRGDEPQGTHGQHGNSPRRVLREWLDCTGGASRSHRSRMGRTRTWSISGIPFGAPSKARRLGMPSSAHFPFGPRGSTVSGRHSSLMNVVISFKEVPHHRIPNPSRFQIARPIIRIQSSSPATPIVKVITGHSGQLVLRGHSPQSVSFIVFLPAYQLTAGGFFPVSVSPSSCRVPRASQAPRSLPASPAPAAPARRLRPWSSSGPIYAIT